MIKIILLFNEAVLCQAIEPKIAITVLLVKLLDFIIGERFPTFISLLAEFHNPSSTDFSF